MSPECFLWLFLEDLFPIAFFVFCFVLSFLAVLDAAIQGNPILHGVCSAPA